MVYNILVMGAGACGKSAFIIRFAEGKFIHKYDCSDGSIDMRYNNCKVELDNKDYYVNIQDTQGQEEYYSLTESLFAGSDGFILMYSISSSTSFDMAGKLRNKIVQSKGAGHKSDLEKERAVTTEEGLRIAEKWQVRFMEASTKDNINVREVFQELVRRMEQNQPQPQTRKNSTCILM